MNKLHLKTVSSCVLQIFCTPSSASFACMWNVLSKSLSVIVNLIYANKKMSYRLRNWVMNMYVIYI